MATVEVNRELNGRRSCSIHGINKKKGAVVVEFSSELRLSQESNGDIWVVKEGI